MCDFYWHAGLTGSPWRNELGYPGNVAQDEDDIAQRSRTEEAMSDQLCYDQGAGGYDRSFGWVSAAFVPTLMRTARLGPGQRVLDVATGTGIAAQAAAAVVGPSGHVVATDISAPMLDQARARLAALPNVSLAIENGEALRQPGESFDKVLCSMGLMLFPDPARGLAEFRRVLHGGGRAAVSVGTTPARSFAARISAAIARHVPSKAESAARYFSLGCLQRLRTLFEAAGFYDVETITEARHFSFPSFEAYFERIASGSGGIASEYVSLPADTRHAVREEVRRGLEGEAAAGGPIEVEVEILFGSGWK